MVEERVNKKVNLYSLLCSDNSSEEDNNSEKVMNVIKTEKTEKTEVINNKPTYQTKKNQYNLNKNTNKNTNIVSNKIEDDMFKQYYGRKTYSNTSYKQNNSNFKNDDSEFKVINRKKDKEKNICECSFKDLEDDFEEKDLLDYFRVLAHHNDDKSWDYNNYHNITILRKWIDIATFFNTLNVAKGECKFTDFDLFLMKNEISPMWEDQENRNGSICSIKIDSIDEGYSIFKELVAHSANHTILKFNPTTWNSINGLSFSTKKIDNMNYDSYCIIIKLWFKFNILNQGPLDKLLNEDVTKLISRYSVKLKAIKPEY